VASFHAMVWWQYGLWNLAGFVGAVVVNSFVEWAVHRWVMHTRNPLVPYGYLHTTSHHATFGADATYEALNEGMLDHGVAFTWREFVLFPLFCAAIYVPVEIVLRRPVLLGCMAAVYAGLAAFNFLHYRFHVPAWRRIDRRLAWVERTGMFRFLNRHHLLHHERMDRNLNVVVPLADLCFGTLSSDDMSPQLPSADLANEALRNTKPAG